jgi:hypothetical protein
VFGNLPYLGWFNQISFGPPVGGTGTVNFVSKWVTAGSIGNSMIFDNGSRIGINNILPTAIFDLPASVAANAPLRIRFGVAPTTPNAGDIWTAGTNLFFNDGVRTNEVAKILKGSANLNFPNTLAQTSSELTITVTGAVPGDAVSLGLPAGAIPANCCYMAYVSVGNTVAVRFCNFSALAINPNTGTFTAIVFKN